MLFPIFCIIYTCILYILDLVRLYLFSLFPSLYSLCPVSLSLSSFIQPTLSRKVPPCKPGPAQGFSLLKGSFSLPRCLPGGSGFGFLTSVKHLETLYEEINWNELKLIPFKLLECCATLSLKYKTFTFWYDSPVEIPALEMIPVF